MLVNYNYLHKCFCYSFYDDSCFNRSSRSFSFHFGFGKSGRTNYTFCVNDKNVFIYKPPLCCFHTGLTLCPYSLQMLLTQYSFMARSLQHCWYGLIAEQTQSLPKLNRIQLSAVGKSARLSICWIDTAWSSLSIKWHLGSCTTITVKGVKRQGRHHGGGGQRGKKLLQRFQKREKLNNMGYFHASKL